MPASNGYERPDNRSETRQKYARDAMPADEMRAALYQARKSAERPTAENFTVVAVPKPIR